MIAVVVGTWQAFNGMPTGWEAIAQASGASHVTEVTVEQLVRRWAHRFAAVAVEPNGRIVGFTSLVPIYDVVGQLRLAARLDIPYVHLPEARVAEFLTGWTAPEYRRQGVSRRLRELVLAQPWPTYAVTGDGGSDTVGVAVTVGVGASHVLDRMGWTVLSWDYVPFLSSLSGIPNVEASHVWPLPEGVGVWGWQGAQRPAGRLDPWVQFWVSSREQAEAFDRHLAHHLDLSDWREAIVATRGREPDPYGWRLITWRQ